MKRIVIGGSIGSGKSTLAKKIAKKLNIEHIELDSLVWLSDWQMHADQKLKELAAKRV